MSTGNLTKTCRYVLVPGKLGQNAVYCCKPCRFKMVEDDDGNKVRKYDTFCDHHKNINNDIED